MIAMAAPQLTTTAPTMASQVARTYAMAKLLGAAGLQLEADDAPIVTPQVRTPSPSSTQPTSQAVTEAAEQPGSQHAFHPVDAMPSQHAPESQGADLPEEQDMSFSTQPGSQHQVHTTTAMEHSGTRRVPEEEVREELEEEEPGFEPLSPDVPIDVSDSPYSANYVGSFPSAATIQDLDESFGNLAFVAPPPNLEQIASQPDTAEADQSTSYFVPESQEEPHEKELPAVPQFEAQRVSPVPGPSNQLAPAEDARLRGEAGDTSQVSSVYSVRTDEHTNGSLQPEADEPLTSVNPLDSPGLLLSVTVNQIRSPTDFEEKFLLLFSDTLVIAKPLAPPEGSESAPRLRAEAFMEKPDLDWSFSVERVVHLHRVGLIVHRDRAPVAKSHALMPSFVRHFSSNPEGAIDQLVQLTSLKKDARTIAKLLYQTPDLNPQTLIEYICAPGRQEVLDAYIGLHTVTGVSIESGLRSFLLGIRFPTDRQHFKALLISFSKHWVASNRTLIKAAFSSGLAANLVFYIMALNDALHSSEMKQQMFSAPRPTYSEADFLQEFRKLDAFGVLSDRTLGRIYASVRAEPIQQALPPRQGQRLSVRVEKGLPTKLTSHVTSDPITVVIDRPDPDFAVRLYGKDFVFEPAVLDFSRSERCSFTITPRSLDAKSIAFVKIGRRAPHYVAVNASTNQEEVPLPKSFSVVIEPKELQHTFTLTIASGDAVKDKVTFSAEDVHQKRVITNALKERIDICIAKKRAKSREEAALEAAAASAASSGSRAAQHSAGRREPSPIPPLNATGAETFAFCETVSGSFLRRVYKHCPAFVSPSTPLAHSPMAGGGPEMLKPHVTLTFAQSLDAKIAGVGGKQLILSGEESMLMTHSLRTLHDGILVGAGTAVNDNPQLNARLLPNPPNVDRLPRPIVLDTQLRTPANCKLLLNYQNGTGRQPLFVCARTASGVRAAELERAGAELVIASCEFDGLLSWRLVLPALARKGITRLMVEGGATVISGLLDSPFVDTLIVTVAPKLIGPQGISHNATLPLAGPSATSERGASETFNLVTSRQFGRDVVFAWRRKEATGSLAAAAAPSGAEPLTSAEPSSYPFGPGPAAPQHNHDTPNPTPVLRRKASHTALSSPPPTSPPAPNAALTKASHPPSSSNNGTSGGGLLGRLASLRRGNSRRNNNQGAEKAKEPVSSTEPDTISKDHREGFPKFHSSRARDPPFHAF